MNKANEDIRKAIKNTGHPQWEIAMKIGIGETTFCRMLRTEMSEAMKEEVLNAIRTFSE